MRGEERRQDNSSCHTTMTTFCVCVCVCVCVCASLYTSHLTHSSVTCVCVCVCVCAMNMTQRDSCTHSPHTLAQTHSRILASPDFWVAVSLMTACCWQCVVWRIWGDT